MDRLNQKALLQAAMWLLRPLVRLLIRYNISFGSFAEVVRQLYVQVAEDEFQLPGKKQTQSRIAVLTGLTRKEVARLRKLPDDNDDALHERFGRCSRVISGWLHDPRFNQDQQPLILSVEAEEPSFNSLVADYSGDMPTRAVLDELIRIGQVALTSDSKVELNRIAYIPNSQQQQKLAMLGRDTADLINTIDHNLNHEGEASHFQLKVEYDNLSREAVDAFKALSDRHSIALLKQYDQWLSQHDRDFQPDIAGQGRYRVGVGIYYFEEELCPDAEQERN